MYKQFAIGFALFFLSFFVLGILAGRDHRRAYTELSLLEHAALVRDGSDILVVVLCDAKPVYRFNTRTRDFEIEPSFAPTPANTWKADAASIDKFSLAILGPGGIALTKQMITKAAPKRPDRIAYAVGSVLGGISGYSIGHWLATRVSCDSHEAREFLVTDDARTNFAQDVGQSFWLNRRDRLLGDDQDADVKADDRVFDHLRHLAKLDSDDFSTIFHDHECKTSR